MKRLIIAALFALAACRPSPGPAVSRDTQVKLHYALVADNTPIYSTETQGAQWMAYGDDRLPAGAWERIAGMSKGQEIGFNLAPETGRYKGKFVQMKVRIDDVRAGK